MSQQDVWNVVGRAKLDRDFANRLFQDPDGTLKSEGVHLSPEELQAALAGQSPPLMGSPWPQSAAQPPQDPALQGLLQQEMAKQYRAQAERNMELGMFTVQTLKDTMKHATSTYKKINIMNQAMFWLGMSLFVFAVGYAVYSHKLDYSLVFAGLGTLSFIATFITGPLGKTQGALSDLISAEIAFMSYFEQIFLIEGLARIPCPDNPMQPDPARVERASELMQLRSAETAELLHRYLTRTDKDAADDTGKTASTSKTTADATGALLSRT
ncbi:Os1348 family NHLP clan protein [Terriglobus aquaticus]|uniref:Os1348 family NHLP clan protein n=1 Tax=Terriglobus aquaticus TaxID=940139 RepID=A0ABW9KPP9_9BACT|nr:Os1348 family NHLP clan protein [Terriglobus aquaticus]